MKKNLQKILIFLLIFIFIFNINVNNSYAVVDTSNSGGYSGGSPDSTSGAYSFC